MVRIGAGRYEGQNLKITWNGRLMVGDYQVQDQDIVGCDLVDASHRIGSGVGSAAAGTILLGPIGLLGGLAAVGKRRMLLLTWRDGEQSLVEVKDKTTYKQLMMMATRGAQAQVIAASKSSTSSEPTNTNTTPTCAVGPCRNPREAGSMYCPKHGPR